MEDFNLRINVISFETEQTFISHLNVMKIEETRSAYLCYGGGWEIIRRQIFCWKNRSRKLRFVKMR